MLSPYNPYSPHSPHYKPMAQYAPVTYPYDITWLRFSKNKRKAPKVQNVAN